VQFCLRILFSPLYPHAALLSMLLMVFGCHRFPMGRYPSLLASSRQIFRRESPFALEFLTRELTLCSSSFSRSAFPSSASLHPYGIWPARSFLSILTLKASFVRRQWYPFPVGPGLPLYSERICRSPFSCQSLP
jgi:hypothetical protein